MGHVLADHLPHDGGGAGQRLNADVDGAFGFQPADQFVVVDDGCDVGVVDRVGQFGGVVRVHDDNRLIRLNASDDARFGQVPFLQHKGGFGVRLAQQDGFGGGSFDFVKVPRPDDRRSCGISVRGFVTKNQSCHSGRCPCRMGCKFAPL